MRSRASASSEFAQRVVLSTGAASGLHQAACAKMRVHAARWKFCESSRISEAIKPIQHQCNHPLSAARAHKSVENIW